MSIRKRAKQFLTKHKASDPIKWIHENVTLRYDPTSAHDGYVKLEPYQLRPILAQYQAEVREVTIMAVEQTGKSACWRFPLLHKMLEFPAPRWIIYESDDKAAEINEEQFDPLLRNVKGLQGQLTRKTALKHRYNLPNGSTLDFSGAGADITSKPKRDGVADEVDTWPLTDDGIRQNLRNFKKRFRTYWARNEGCLVKVSSPSPRKKGEKIDLTKSAIAEEFEKSDAGYWTLRCLNCNGLTIPSHAIYMLDWENEEIDGEKKVKAETITLDCPVCKYQHLQRQAQQMNDLGAYCTKGGTEIKQWSRSIGCQWGALACPRVFSWQLIAEEQIASGKSADKYTQANFDNSWRGLPFKPRKQDPAGIASIKKHCAPLPDSGIFANVFFSADTQDTGWYFVVRAVDDKGNLYKLANGFVRTPQELEQAWNTKYMGLLPIMGIIDEGGHGDMPKHVMDLVSREKGLYSYKGGSFGEKWRKGNNPNTILASAKQYKADLLYYMYSQSDTSNHYWFLPPFETIEQEYLEQICAIQENTRSKHGNKYENWEVPSKGTPDHYFDCEKQLLVILDVAYKELPAGSWLKPVSNVRRGNKRKTPKVQL